MFHSVSAHLAQGVGEISFPVAVPPIDGQANAMGIEFGAQCGNEFAALIIDWAFAAEVVIVFCDFVEAFGRNAPAACHIFQKRHYIFGLLRAAEGNNQNRIVHEGLFWDAADAMQL